MIGPILGKLSSILGQTPTRPAPRPAAEPTRVHVMRGDSLEITFRRGNTLSQTAKSYGEPVGGSVPGARRAFLLNLIAQNGGKDTIIAGRTFKIATDDQNMALNATIAVQKSIAARLRQGQLFPPFDFNNATVAPGPYHATVVTLPSSMGIQSFYVFDDASGDDASLYSVFTQDEFEKAQGH